MRAIAAAALAVILAFGATAPATQASASVSAAGPGVNPVSVSRGADGEKPAPLIVLIDTSGSMNDTVDRTDGSGTVVKLDAAKSALHEPISNQPPGATVGIWTFPSGGNCGAGDWLVDPSSGLSAAAIIDRIDDLAAGGSTPTGPALSAVVERLKARGIASANILLVSDGLYSCGDNPCEVAKQLGGSGFDVSIQAVGFDISDQGRDSLKCMADATGGHYFDASNSAELDQVIAQLTTPAFTLNVTGEKAPVAGKATTLTATVTNTSAFDAHDVKVSLAFSGAQGGLQPRVVPAVIPMGTLPAGRSITRSWTFVAGVAERRQLAQYSVSALSIETAPVQYSGSFTTAAPGFTAGDAGPLLRDLIKRKESLVILGDSYSSGEGTGKYLPASADAAAACHRSPQTYLAPAFDATKLRVEILACSGATSGALTSVQINTDSGVGLATPQLQQLDALGSVPGAGVMTFGGNDIGFKDIVTRCVERNCTKDQGWINLSLANAAAVGATLRSQYELAWAHLNQAKYLAERDGRYAPLIVINYPLVIHADSAGSCSPVGFSTSEVDFANELETVLDASIADAVRVARSDGYPIYDVDLTRTALRPDHSICEDGGQAWVNQIQLGLPNGILSESFHPNMQGYQAISDAIIAWSKTAEVKKPSGDAVTGSIPHFGGAFDILNTGVGSNDNVAVNFTARASTAVHPGQGVKVALTGMGALPATATLFSQPRLLGTLVPDANGRLGGYLSIPADTPYGAHKIVIHGWSAAGDPIVRSARIVVVPRTPVWVVGTGILSGLVVIAGCVILLVWRRGRRRRRISTTSG